MPTRKKALNGNDAKTPSKDGLKKKVMGRPQKVVTSDKNKYTLENKKNKAGSQQDKSALMKPLISKDSPLYPMMQLAVKLLQAMMGELPIPLSCACFEYTGPTGTGGIPYFDAAGETQFLPNPPGPGRTIGCDGPEGPIFWGV